MASHLGLVQPDQLCDEGLQQAADLITLQRMAKQAVQLGICSSNWMRPEKCSAIMARHWLWVPRLQQGPGQRLHRVKVVAERLPVLRHGGGHQLAGEQAGPHPGPGQALRRPPVERLGPGAVTVELVLCGVCSSRLEREAMKIIAS